MQSTNMHNPWRAAAWPHGRILHEAANHICLWHCPHNAVANRRLQLFTLHGALLYIRHPTCSNQDIQGRPQQGCCFTFMGRQHTSGAHLQVIQSTVQDDGPAALPVQVSPFGGLPFWY